MTITAPPLHYGKPAWWLAGLGNRSRSLPAHKDCIHRRYRLTCAQFEDLVASPRPPTANGGTVSTRTTSAQPTATWARSRSMTETNLTPDEQAEADRMLAELHRNGYTDVDSHGELTAGARVRHRGHRWPEAYTDGSGFVLAVVEKPDSSWSQNWGGPDIELVVVWDKPTFGSRLSGVADYHVEVVG